MIKFCSKIVHFFVRSFIFSDKLLKLKSSSISSSLDSSFLQYKTFYTKWQWQKGVLIKVPILTLSSALVKICQIPHDIFQTTSQFSFQILHHSSVSWKMAPLYCFSSNIIYFAQKEHIKVKIFETFKCLGQNHQTFYVNFETTSQFLFKFCIILLCCDT